MIQQRRKHTHSKARSTQQPQATTVQNSTSRRRIHTHRQKRSGNRPATQRPHAQKGGRNFAPLSAQRSLIDPLTLSRARDTSDYALRRDMRLVPTFTIDPEDAKDFDDAISVLKVSEYLYEIGIHIADVSFFIPYNSRLDLEARRKATSIYRVGAVEHMLPAELSEDLCSLTPLSDKRALSVVFTVSRDGTIHDSWIGETLIHSKKRFTYASAQETFESHSGQYNDELAVLYDIARMWKSQRKMSGGIDFPQQEIMCVLNDKMQPIAIQQKPYYESMSVIEECMLKANVRIAELMAQESKTRLYGHIYRTHAEPSGTKVLLFQKMMKATHHTVSIVDGTLKRSSIQALVEAVHGTSEEQFVTQALLRTMPKAIYSIKNTGHFGLGFSTYTHFTSPIRRYPDIMVHRITKNILKHKPMSHDEIESYKHACVTSTEKEIEAQEAERDSIKHMQVLYMQSKIGTIVSGVITGIIPGGMFVKDTTTHTEGYISLKRFGAAATFNEAHLTIVTPSRVYRLGEPVMARIDKVNTVKKFVDMTLLPNAAR